MKQMRKYMLRGELERMAESYALVGEKIKEYREGIGNDAWIKGYIERNGEYWAKEVQEKAE